MVSFQMNNSNQNKHYAGNKTFKNFESLIL